MKFKCLFLAVLSALTLNANAAHPLLTGATTTAGFGIVGGQPSKRTIFCWGLTTAGAGTATIKAKISNDGVYYRTIASIALTLATTVADDTNTEALAVDAPWPYLKLQVSAISGTGAAVTCDVGVGQ